MTIQISRATRVVSLCVNADLYGQWQDAEAAREDAVKRNAADARENDTSVRDAAARVTEIEGTMLAHTIRFTLQAMRRKDWALFVAANPPREGDPLDKVFGVDVSALDDAIVKTTVAVVDPNGDPVGIDMAADWETLADEMAQPQWEPFAQAVLALNQGTGSANVPFSLAASREMRRSAKTSSSQSVSE